VLEAALRGWSDCRAYVDRLMEYLPEEGKGADWLPVDRSEVRVHTDRGGLSGADIVTEGNRHIFLLPSTLCLPGVVICIFILRVYSSHQVLKLKKMCVGNALYAHKLSLYNKSLSEKNNDAATGKNPRGNTVRSRTWSFCFSTISTFVA